MSLPVFQENPRLAARLHEMFAADAAALAGPGEDVPESYWETSATILLALFQASSAADRRDHTAVVLASLFSATDMPITEARWYQHADELLADLDTYLDTTTP